MLCGVALIAHKGNAYILASLFFFFFSFASFVYVNGTVKDWLKALAGQFQGNVATKERLNILAKESKFVSIRLLRRVAVELAHTKAPLHDNDAEVVVAVVVLAEGGNVLFKPKAKLFRGFVMEERSQQLVLRKGLLAQASVAGVEARIVVGRARFGEVERRSTCPCATMAKVRLSLCHATKRSLQKD